MDNYKTRCAGLVALAVALSLGGLMVAACGQPSSPAPATPAEPSGGSAAEPTSEAVVTAPTSADSSAGITLTWWTPESFSPMGGGLSGEVLLEQVAGFVGQNPDIGVQPILKAAHGKGGILDFLRTASARAPSVLPHVVTIDSSDLPSAVQNGLLQPLDDLLSPELRADLFPFALAVSRFEGQSYAVQFEADIQHLVYHSDKVPLPPTTWDELLSGGSSFLFPAAGRQELINDASLIQYMGAGGTFDQSTRQLMLEEQPLLEMLRFYEQGTQRRLFPAGVLTLDGAEACWPVYLSEQADMTIALASRYLAEREALQDTEFAAIPTKDGQPVTVSRGWTLAIVATDSAHRTAAVQFVEWLLAAERSAAWTKAAGRLPARRAALDVWGAGDEYAAFLRSQLDAAVYRPSGAGFLGTARWMQQAVRDVLTGTASADAAAQQAMQAAGS